MQKLQDPLQQAQLLVQAVTYYSFNHSIENFSVDALAAALGTSTQLLLNHFGTTEALLTGIVAEAEHQTFQRFSIWVEDAGLLTALEKLWHQLVDEETTAFFYSIMMFIRKEENAALYHSVIQSWTENLTFHFAQAGVPPTTGRGLATLTVATLHGLMLNRLSPGQEAVVEEGFQQLLRLLRHELHSTELQ
jgi:AcrR family transcriptional regulator